MLVNVTTDGVPTYELDVKTRDIALWEMAGRDRGIEQLKSPSMTTIYQLTHIAARRLNLTALNFDEFVAATDVEVIPEVEEANPTVATEPSAA